MDREQRASGSLGPAEGVPARVQNDNWTPLRTTIGPNWIPSSFRWILANGTEQAWYQELSKNRGDRSNGREDKGV